MKKVQETDEEMLEATEEEDELEETDEEEAETEDDDEDEVELVETDSNATEEEEELEETDEEEAETEDDDEVELVETDSNATEEDDKLESVDMDANAGRPASILLRGFGQESRVYSMSMVAYIMYMEFFKWIFHFKIVNVRGSQCLRSMYLRRFAGRGLCYPYGKATARKLRTWA